MNKITIRQLTASTLLWLAACAIVAFTGNAANAQGSPNKLESIDVQNIAGQQVQLTLHHSSPPSEPVAFTIDNPARISLDLANTALAIPSRRIDVRSGGVDSVLAAEAAGRTRLVLNLDRLLPYQTRVQGNDVIVLIGGASSSPTAAAAASSGASGSPVAPSSAAAAPSGPRAIRGIDFRRGAGGTGRVIVRLSDPHTPASLRQLGNQIVVDFAGAEVASNLARRYDAGDFATPVTGFDVVRVGDGVRLAISASGDFEHLAYQSDDQYVVEVQPSRKAQSKVEDKRIYTGERLTLNFQDIETRAVLQLLADASGQNIVVSDSVSGSVTLRLQNVPWDQALDIVLRTKGLDKRRNDNVIIVAPTEELASREKAELAAHADVADLSPLRSEYLQVNYAKAADLASLIKTQGSAAGGLLSKRGTVSVDERTNTLLLQDSADRLDDIRRLVGTLDIPIRQVQIEARIVIVSDDFSRELGVRAGFTGNQANGNDGLFATSGTSQSVNTTLDSALANLGGGGATPYPVAVPAGTASPQRYNVNLPVASPAGSLAFMILGSDYLVDLEISAAQAEGRGEVISTPRVITANQREASIEQGVEIPYQESASSGATTIQFKKAVLALRVTPQITPDNRIILDLNVKKDSVGQVIVGGAGQQVPSIDTREITTSVIVNDGQTVVLGGILETERRETEKKVPYLGDIPVLGRLFKTTAKTNNKDELLIFVTPKILREGVSVY
ncbi:MAG: type IV pilus secretin PilQ [Pseudomonadota bacterium]